MTSPIDLRIDDGVATLVLDRPGAGNAISMALARRFRDAAAELLAAGPRAVVIAGRGDLFCAGGDVREIGAADDMPAFLDELVGTFHEGLSRLASIDAVTIAAIDGAAAGAGLGIALNADVRVASERASFMTAYETIGLTPDCGVTYLLPRAIGAGRASAMAATSRRLDAAEALEVGLITELVPAGGAEPRAVELARRAAARPQSHMAATRRLLRGDADGTYERALDHERRAIVAAARDAEVVRRVRGSLR